MAKKEKINMVKCINCGNIFPFEAAENGEIHCPCNNVFPIDDGEIIEVETKIITISSTQRNEILGFIAKRKEQSKRELLLSLKIYLVVSFYTFFIYFLSIDYQLHGKIKIFGILMISVAITATIKLMGLFRR